MHTYTLTLPTERATEMFPVLHDFLEHLFSPFIKQGLFFLLLKFCRDLWSPKHVECLSLKARMRMGIQSPLVS